MLPLNLNWILYSHPSELIFTSHPVTCTWLHGFTSHLKVHTCTRQGTVVAGLTAARQPSSGTTLSFPWTNWTQDTFLWATPRSQDTEQGDVLNTFHLDEWRWWWDDFRPFLFLFFCKNQQTACAKFTLQGSCEYYMKPLLLVWESRCSCNPPTPPPPPLHLPL